MKIQTLVYAGLITLIIRSEIVSAAEAVEGEMTSTIKATLANEAETTAPIIERSSHAHVHVEPTFKGFWAKKFAWRPRWVKTWQEKKVYVAVWKRMWGPVEVKEWVPVPKPPPGWVKHNAGSYIVKKAPHH